MVCDTNLEISVTNTSAMTIVHRINQLLEELSCFTFVQFFQISLNKKNH